MTNHGSAFPSQSTALRGDYPAPIRAKHDPCTRLQRTPRTLARHDLRFQNPNATYLIIIGTPAGIPAITIPISITAALTKVTRIPIFARSLKLK